MKKKKKNVMKMARFSCWKTFLKKVAEILENLKESKIYEIKVYPYASFVLFLSPGEINMNSPSRQVDFVWCWTVYPWKNKDKIWMLLHIVIMRQNHELVNIECSNFFDNSFSKSKVMSLFQVEEVLEVP